MAEKEFARLEIRVGSHAEQSERIAELRKRASRCVCKSCGEKLSLRKITYAAYDEAKIEVYWGFKNTGLLDKDGFKTALDLEAGVLGEAMFISDTALNGMKGE